MRWLPPKRLGVVCTVLAVGAASVVGCSSDGNGNGGAAGQAASAGHSNVGGATGGSGSGAGGVAVAGSGGGSPGGSGGSAGLSGSAGAGGQGGNATLASCAVSAIDADQPKLLSETGCIDMTDPAKPAPGLVPYAVNSPLWSDGAAKERFVAIPEGEKIHVLDCAIEPTKCVDTGLGGSGGDDGHWQMPIGTVLVKNFSVKGQRIETRLFMRRSETAWKGFSYEWNETETDATLLPAEKDRQLDGQVWHYPSRGQCLECHTKAGGRSLGPTTAQMNADYAYADGSMNQLAKFQALGLFDATPKTMPAYPDPYGAAGTLEQRARSYLQTNCAICHRPGGEFSSVDMRFTTDFADMKLCNEPSERDTALAKFRLVPTKPDESALSLRMHANFASNVRMPKIGSNVVDTPGAALIDTWITGITACPPPQ